MDVVSGSRGSHEDGGHLPYVTSSSESRLVAQSTTPFGDDAFRRDERYPTDGELGESVHV
eukprot:3767734-Pleurochrysis_carterae.AAC.1